MDWRTPRGSCGVVLASAAASASAWRQALRLQWLHWLQSDLYLSLYLLA